MIQARVDDAAVVGGRFLADTGVTFDDTDRLAAQGDGQRARQTDDATADYQNHRDIVSVAGYETRADCDIFVG